MSSLYFVSRSNGLSPGQKHDADVIQAASTTLSEFQTDLPSGMLTRSPCKLLDELKLCVSLANSGDLNALYNYQQRVFHIMSAILNLEGRGHG